jgi:hypothetical protein
MRTLKKTLQYGVMGLYGGPKMIRILVPFETQNTSKIQKKKKKKKPQLFFVILLFKIFTLKFDNAPKQVILNTYRCDKMS